MEMCTAPFLLKLMLVTENVQLLSTQNWSITSSRSRSWHQTEHMVMKPSKPSIILTTGLHSSSSRTTFIVRPWCFLITSKSVEDDLSSQDVRGRVPFSTLHSFICGQGVSPFPSKENNLQFSREPQNVLSNPVTSYKRLHPSHCAILVSS